MYIHKTGEWACWETELKQKKTQKRKQKKKQKAKNQTNKTKQQICIHTYIYIGWYKNLITRCELILVAQSYVAPLHRYDYPHKILYYDNVLIIGDDWA